MVWARRSRSPSPRRGEGFVSYERSELDAKGEGGLHSPERAEPPHPVCLSSPALAKANATSPLRGEGENNWRRQ